MRKEKGKFKPLEPISREWLDQAIFHFLDNAVIDRGD